MRCSGLGHAAFSLETQRGQQHPCWLRSLQDFLPEVFWNDRIRKLKSSLAAYTALEIGVRLSAVSFILLRSLYAAKVIGVIFSATDQHTVFLTAI